ncbi:MAG: hypothetical protein ACRENS_01225 [Candidatus Eiseniibacteriota bacterium]
MDQYGKDQVWDEGPSGRETEKENRATLAAAWSPTPALRLVVGVPFTARTISNPDGSSYLRGLSDPDLNAQYAFFRSASGRPQWMAITGGIKSSWGQNDRNIDGVRADEHLQPGSGAITYSAGLAYALDQSALAHWYASAGGRWSERNASGYRYGDALTAVAAYQRGVSSWISAAAEFDYRVTDKDDDAGTLDPNTGGSVLYFAPRVNLAFGGPVALKLGVQIPIAQHLYGDQNEHTNLLTGLVFAL